MTPVTPGSELTLVLALLAGFAGPAAAWCLAARRRRRLLNECLHELRRPLHCLGLMLEGAAPAGGPELVDQAAHALAELDCLVNGVAPTRDRAQLSMDGLTTAAGRRWAGWIEVELGPGARGASVVGDRRRLGAALDNLIANALEHGSGGVRLRTRSTGSAVKVEVAESDRARAVAPPRGPRRGNGLRLAARIAAEHGGALAPPRPDGGRTVAGIELPLAGPAPGSRAG